MALTSRIPELFGTKAYTGAIYAFECTTDGDSVPSGKDGFTPGSAWKHDACDNLVPTGATVIGDPYWTLDVDDNLVAVACDSITSVAYDCDYSIVSVLDDLVIAQLPSSNANISGEVDGINTDFQILTYNNAKLIRVDLNDNVQTDTVDYTYDTGTQTVSFTVAPVLLDEVVISFIGTN